MEVDRTADNYPDLQDSSDDSTPNLAERKLRRNDSLDVESRTIPGAGSHGHKVHFASLDDHIYIYTHIHIHVYIHTHIHTYIYILLDDGSPTSANLRNDHGFISEEY